MSTSKKRNPYAPIANQRKAGRHTDRKKKENKRACRKNASV